MELAGNMGRCFVTGAAGFIGSHLVEYLLAGGNAVTGYDNLSSGKKVWLESAATNRQFQFVEADLLDEARLTGAMEGHDVVFHLGANTDIPLGNQDPRIDFENCIKGTFNVLQAMRTVNTRRILFASSSTVYGEHPIRPTPETSGPLLPITHYGAGKLAGEGLVSSFCDLYGMRGWVYRFGNVVGPRMGHGVIFDFIRKLRQDPMALEILGDGNQEKNYFLVEDCIEGILHASRYAGEASCQVFNLGTDSTVRVTEVANIVESEMGLHGVVHHFTGGDRGWPGDVPIVSYDMHKMESLGWRARASSAEAVRIATRRLLSSAQPVG